MLKTLALALLTIAVSVAYAQAHYTGHKHRHSQAVPWPNRQLRHALAVWRPITVRCCVRRGNGATPTKPARCEEACHAR
jgi:hypothetical protein